jgi:hypothetical protein
MVSSAAKRSKIQRGERSTGLAGGARGGPANFVLVRRRQSARNRDLSPTTECVRRSLRRLENRTESENKKTIDGEPYDFATDS